MNRSEAIDALKLGKTIRHKYFPPGETIRGEGSWYLFEDGTRCMPPVYWRDRQGEAYNEGWSIVESAE
ncbi:hypothetical protein [Vibrio owensii]|uniref:hypothetical protein n=1 Tax=Vibrio owensii TaxID=696485 RepID=UPI0018F10DD4|nr:hypothetical protein [Vibrio owensii]